MSNPIDLRHVVPPWALKLHFVVEYQPGATLPFWVRLPGPGLEHCDKGKIKTRDVMGQGATLPEAFDRAGGARRLQEIQVADALENPPASGVVQFPGGTE
jgi:hypothetical protein